MSKFDEFIEKMGEGLKGLSRTSLKEFKDAATSDAKDFLEKYKADLQKWIEDLANGELSEEDFEDLVLGRKDIAEMYALKKAGVALAKMDLFKCRLADLIIDTAFSVFV
jgi:hypothetical protein